MQIQQSKDALDRIKGGSQDVTGIGPALCRLTRDSP